MTPVPAPFMPTEILAFRNTLRGPDQAAFDQLYAAAAENLKLLDALPLVIPLEKTLLAIIVEQQRQISELHRKIG